MPFPYTTRISTRAKRLQIRIHTSGDIEVIIPKHYDMHKVPTFIAQQTTWVNRTLQRIQQQPTVVEQQIQRPNTVSLPALKQHWQISYRNDARPRTTITPDDPSTIHIAGNGDEQHHRMLLNWLHEHAKAQLIPWLRSVSNELALPFNKATVRAQKTRWGSCSAKGNININRSLLFLQPAVVRYLFIHELCHTIHLNHSRRYWLLVETFEPNYRALDQSLRRAMQTVPDWAQPHRAPQGDGAPGIGYTY